MKTKTLLESGQRVQSRIETSTWLRMNQVRDGGLDEEPGKLVSSPAASLSKLLILTKSLDLFRCHSRLSRPFLLRKLNWHGFVMSVQFPQATWLLGCVTAAASSLCGELGNWKELQVHSFKFCLASTRGWYEWVAQKWHWNVKANIQGRVAPASCANWSWNLLAQAILRTTALPRLSLMSG